MDEQTMRSQSEQFQREASKVAAPLQAAWRKVYFDLPLTMVSEVMRFAGQRLQAQGEFLANLKTCHTVPDLMEVQSDFMRTAVDDYGVETSRLMNDVRSSVNKAD
jgi:hypothetical protein